jgi:hypothetical protein
MGSGGDAYFQFGYDGYGRLRPFLEAVPAGALSYDWPAQRAGHVA